MDAHFLETEFTVADRIALNHSLLARFPELGGAGQGTLLVLLPASTATAGDLTALNATAFTPAGRAVPLEFDRVVVNGAGCIGLFFADRFDDVLPWGTTIRFSESAPMEQSAAAEEDDGFVYQGRLGVREAEKILARLEQEGIRFEIDTDATPGYRGTGENIRVNDHRIDLFIHADDLPKWAEIRGEYLPG